MKSISSAFGVNEVFSFPIDLSSQGIPLHFHDDINNMGLPLDSTSDSIHRIMRRVSCDVGEDKANSHYSIEVETQVIRGGDEGLLESYTRIWS
jgi:hypothetical protein